ncbi:MAG TPA: cation diffusion facilitator family transporter [Vicinamibacteria bacterium]|nr:cation diffusion facilitator family transporter [Vicinamibacteria bacterium]
MSTSAAHAHPHGHAHGRGAPIPHLALALAITLLSMGVEVGGGLLSGSLAVLSDAGHMLADAGALALALFAQVVASRPRTDRRTYGWRRVETLAAFLNGIALGVTAVFIVSEAVVRWRTPQPVRGGLMLAVAAFGLVANLAAAAVLARAEGNENTRAALAHVISDAAGSVAAILAGLLVVGFGWSRADSAASVVVAALVLWSAWRLLRRTASVLLESSPPGLAMADLERTIRETPGVSDLHDLHAWRISDGFDAVTVHVVLDGARHGTDVAREVARRVREGHGIAHVTVQPEAPAVAATLQLQRPARRR